MKNNNKNFIYVLLILVPLILVLTPFFKSLHLAWGDAPFYYPEGLMELVNKPLIWTEKGIPFGGKNLALWLSPLMLLYGSLNKMFSFDNDLIIRIIFYYPSVLSALIGIYSLTKYLKLSKIAQFFAVIVYLFNTYYLLLIDGGQVGVSLAYGIFPLALLFWIKYFDKLDINSFYLALLASSVLTYIDPRVTIILYIFLLLWIIFDSKSFLLKRIVGIITSSILLVFLNMFWLLPFLKSSSNNLSLDVSNLQLSSILNSLLLFSPHWPSNIFGKVVAPYFYFFLVPLLIFAGFLFKKVERKYYFFVFTFLLFSFLAKGSTPPLGMFYNFFINEVPFGAMFRDSSKFFIPLMLLSGLLIGHTVEKIQTHINNRILKIGFVASCYLYLLFIISPALLNKLNLNLSNRVENNDYQIIYNHLRKEKGGFRTLWITDKPQMAFETIDKPAISASQLTTFRPFSSINNSEDVFNFLNNPNFVDWLRTLGIKYIFLSGDSRNVLPTETDIKNWNEIKRLIGENRNLIKLNWNTEMSIYEISNPNSFVSTTNQLMAVVGPDLDKTLLSVYFEDGKFDPDVLFEADTGSLKLVFNNSNKLDLAFTFLQQYFKSVDESENPEWAIYNTNQYLKAKYELFIRSYVYHDFDYGKGLAFSTKKGEKIKFKFDIPVDGNYVVTKRIGTLDKQKLVWQIEKKSLKKGVFEYVVENESNLSVLNTVAIIPENEFNNSVLKASSFISKFENDTKVLKDNWLITNYNFDTNWILKDSKIHIPVYSMINGFYLNDDVQNTSVSYKTQKYVDLGSIISLTSVLILVVSYFSYVISKLYNKQ